MISVLIPVLLEAALRALVVGLAVWAGLRVLRVGNVLAQKAVWGLVLLAALAMPMLVPVMARWHWLPGVAALRLPAVAWGQTTEAPREALPVVVNPVRIEARNDAVPVKAMQQESLPVSEPVAEGGDRFPAPVISYSEYDAPTPAAAQAMIPTIATPTEPHGMKLTPLAIGWLIYLGVCAVLLIRLALGLVSAARVWRAAEPICLPEEIELAAGMRLRWSDRLASPVTIGSGIVLPAGYAEWDREKLRIVLAHERSHIRQGDFYLQVIAGLHAALFWFSPLGWWLKRKLTDLGEAISDLAGVDEAASRSTYAQILLEFAALPRFTPIGVAMARSSNLSLRIERLLNDTSFRQAFAAGGRRALLAVMLVPAALIAATALIRVEAATLPGSVAQAAQRAPTTGQSNPDPTPIQTTEPRQAPAAAPDPAAAPAPPQSFEVILPRSPGALPAPAALPAPPIGPVDVEPRIQIAVPLAPLPPDPPATIELQTDGMGHRKLKTFSMVIPRGSMVIQENGASSDDAKVLRFKAKSYAYAYTTGGDDYAIVGDPGAHIRMSGEWDDDRKSDIEKARKVAHGHFLWFRHDGKDYVVDDPTIVAQIEEMNKPLEDLGHQMGELGKQQKAFGEQQRELAKNFRDATVPTPDLTKEMADLNAAVESLKAKQGGTINQKELGDLQREVGRIQGELGRLQGKIMTEEIRGNMGKFGEQQGQLGGQMGKMGSEMGRLARENQEKIKGMIDESLKNGKAKPVE